MQKQETDGGPWVLVVDDIRSSRVLAKRILHRHAFRVLESDNQEDALQQLKTYQDTIRVVVADWLLGYGRDGLALLRAVKAWYPHIGTVLWTVDDTGCFLAKEYDICCVAKGGGLASNRRLIDAIDGEMNKKPGAA